MTGAIMGTIGGVGGAGGSGGTPDALDWNNIYANGVGSTQSLTIAGVGSGSSSITATNSGSAALSYNLNGTTHVYSGAFDVSDGNTLSWFLINLTTSTKSGTVVVSSGSSTLSTFTYVVTGNNYF